MDIENVFNVGLEDFVDACLFNFVPDFLNRREGHVERESVELLVWRNVFLDLRLNLLECLDSTLVFPAVFVFNPSSINHRSCIWLTLHSIIVPTWGSCRIIHHIILLIFIRKLSLVKKHRFGKVR